MALPRDIPTRDQRAKAAGISGLYQRRHEAELRLSAAEVNYCMDREWARNADDMLWRRSKLGLRILPEGRAALERYMTARGMR